MNWNTIGIAGHAGIGHVNGVNGFIQDDTAGFIISSYIIKQLYNIDTRIKEIIYDRENNSLQIETISGGKAHTALNLNITPQEIDLMQRLKNKDALFCQKAVLETFGRIYGQGLLELPVILCGLLANTVLDSFKKVIGEKFILKSECIKINSGFISGINFQIDQKDIAVMSTVNWSTDGNNWTSYRQPVYIGENTSVDLFIKIRALDNSDSDLEVSFRVDNNPEVIMERVGDEPYFTTNVTLSPGDHEIILITTDDGQDVIFSSAGDGPFQTSRTVTLEVLQGQKE